MSIEQGAPAPIQLDVPDASSNSLAGVLAEISHNASLKSPLSGILPYHETSLLEVMNTPTEVVEPMTPYQQELTNLIRTPEAVQLVQYIAGEDNQEHIGEPDTTYYTEPSSSAINAEPPLHTEAHTHHVTPTEVVGTVAQVVAAAAGGHANHALYVEATPVTMAPVQNLAVGEILGADNMVTFDNVVQMEELAATPDATPTQANPIHVNDGEGGGEPPTATATATKTPDATATATATHIATATPTPTETSHYFPETKHTVDGELLKYWKEHGGLPILGYPISDAKTEVSDTNGQPYTTQWFERATLEIHPENKPPFNVLGSLLGAQVYKEKYPNGAPDQHPDPAKDTVIIPETGKHLGGKFKAFWQSHGGIPILGYPISEEFQEKSDLNGKTFTVQYFERNVLEYHPENAGTPFEILASQLGTTEYGKTHNLQGEKLPPDQRTPQPSPYPDGTPAPIGTPDATPDATPGGGSSTPTETATPSPTPTEVAPSPEPASNLGRKIEDQQIDAAGSKPVELAYYFDHDHPANAFEFLKIVDPVKLSEVQEIIGTGAQRNVQFVMQVVPDDFGITEDAATQFGHIRGQSDTLFDNSTHKLYVQYGNRDVAGQPRQVIITVHQADNDYFRAIATGNDTAKQTALGDAFSRATMSVLLSDGTDLPDSLQIGNIYNDLKARNFNQYQTLSNDLHSHLFTASQH